MRMEDLCGLIVGCHFFSKSSSDLQDRLQGDKGNPLAGGFPLTPCTPYPFPAAQGALWAILMIGRSGSPPGPMEDHFRSGVNDRRSLQGPDLPSLRSVRGLGPVGHLSGRESLLMKDLDSFEEKVCLFFKKHRAQTAVQTGECGIRGARDGRGASNSGDASLIRSDQFVLPLKLN